MSNNIQMNFLPKTISISDLQKRAKEVFVRTNEDGVPTVVLSRNETVGVLLKPAIFEELMEIYEDYLDGLELEEAVKATPRKNFKSWSKVKADLAKG